MFLRKCVSIVFLFLVLFFSLETQIMAQTNSKRLTKIRNIAEKISKADDATVRVWLKNKKKIKGYLSRVEKDYFVVLEFKTQKTRKIPYSQVRKIKGKTHFTDENIAGYLGFTLFVLAMSQMTKD